MPIPTPTGLDIAKANEKAAVERNGLFGSILSNAIPIEMAANILCKDIVHRFLHASPSVAEIYLGEIVVRFAKRKHNSLKLADESYGF